VTSISQDVGRTTKRRKIESPSKIDNEPIDVDSEAISDVEIQYTAKNDTETLERDTTLLVRTNHSAKTPTRQEKERPLTTGSTHPGLLKYTAPAYHDQCDEDDTSTGINQTTPRSSFHSGKDASNQASLEKEEERKRRRERWQTRIGQGMVAPRRNSLPLDQAEQEQLEEDDTDFEALGDHVEDIDTVTSGSSRTNTKAKPSKVIKSGKGKKKEEVGPSGMTYTPLEKQVRTTSGDPRCSVLTTSLAFDTVHRD
jgi:hypothetical protein